jgi:uncharacterized protein (TIGR02118 family)
MSRDCYKPTKEKKMGDSAKGGQVRSVFLITRKEGMSYEDFEKYWIEVHGALAKKVPNYLWYAQHHFPAPEDGGCATGEFGIDGIAEFLYASAEDREKAWASPEGQDAFDDVKNVFSRVQEFTFEEIVLEDRR